MAGSETRRVIDIRELSSRDELEHAVRLQREIWGFAEVDLLPRRLFVVATKIGGQVFGAFDAGEMVAFLLAIPGLKPGGYAYLHSHMMGVLPDYRDLGIGRMLKLRQRNHALAQGVTLVEWTFDPLEIKNAYFNIERLGAVVRRYVLNQYGSTTSHLHGGLPTDRCVAEWHIASDRVRRVLDGQGRPSVRIEAEISVPNDILAWRTQDPARARQEQQRISDLFCDHFRQGLSVLGFRRETAAGTYLLGQWEPSA